MRTAGLLVVAVMVVLAGCGGTGVTPSETPSDTTPSATPDETTPSATPTPTPTSTPNGSEAVQQAPPDPEEDVIGWEDGYWYNESIDVDRSDGLNESELNATVSRAMARVEEVRGWEFEERVPVEIVSREEFQENLAAGEGPSTPERLHQNVKFEATFIVNESTDAIAVQQSTLGASVLGYYSPTQERIVIVSENTTSPEMNEITLAQELFHALQDQKYDTTQYDQSTREDHNAVDGIIEGDGNYVDYLYQQRCESDWDCLLPSGGQSGGSGANVGLTVMQFVPYAEGPEFVQELREEGGWAAVDAVYDNPPASTEQIIHHDRYPDDEPTEVTVEDRSTDEWRVPELAGGVNYAEFGEGGLYTTLWYASYEASAESGSPTTVAIPYRSLLNAGPNGELDELAPYTYSHPYTEGWAGDRLVPYARDDSATSNETGYVWKIEWDSAADAEEFAEGYRLLIEYHGAESVDGRQDTYRISDDREFGDAFYVHVDGSTVVIVNAPTVEELDEVREGAGTAS
jgi:hypothetical protein